MERSKKGLLMKRFLQLWILSWTLSFCAHDRNLVIIVDNLHQETVKTEEINMTHQCLTALQQRASLVLVSTGLWKNIVQRKKKFEKELADPISLQSAIFAMYQETNQKLQDARYNLAVVNQKLSHSWFVSHYPQLAQLSEEKLNQLRFDFYCYTFQFDMGRWHVYNAQEGMLLFIPQECNLRCDEKYELFDERDLLKHSDKKSYPVASLEKLLSVHTKDRWIVYATGHGHPQSHKQGANIAGLKIDEFKKMLLYLHEQVQTKLLVYSSCYGGGVHTIEPYANIQLNYPVIVTATTDAPIFGFGLFEGVKLPPYDTAYKLQTSDVSKQCGLLPYAMQNYVAFFKRAWKGQFDLNLIQCISRFFMCDFVVCHVQKIENFPLIRKAGSRFFIPMRDGVMMKLVQQATTNSSFHVTKPLLLYSKKIKKLKLDRPWQIISMLPGMQSHEIGELFAPQVTLSQLIADSLLSLEDMQAYKNFMIKKLTCLNDFSVSDNVAQKSIVMLTNVLILHQEQLKPKFLQTHADAVIYFECAGKHYLAVWQDHKINEVMLLDKEQIEQMQTIAKFVQQAVNFDALQAPIKLLTYDAYLDSKTHQQELVDDCVKIKACKK